MASLSSLELALHLAQGLARREDGLTSLDCVVSSTSR